MGRLNRFSVLFGFLFLVLSFQNCTSQEEALDSGSLGSNRSVGVELSGGDIGYEGKLTYGFQDIETVCDDGLKLIDRIEVDVETSTAVKTRENCQEISGQPISFDSLDLMPHNLSNFVETRSIFEEYKRKLPDGVLVAYCRGQAKPNDRGTVFVDITVRKLPDDSYKARLAGGLYDFNGELVESRDSGEVDVKYVIERDDPRRRRLIYHKDGIRQWHISLKTHKNMGSVQYYVRSGESWGDIWNFPCTFNGIE